MTDHLDLKTLTIDDFRQHLDTAFELSTPQASVTILLAQVNDLGPALREGGAFSLLFTAADRPVLPQAIYSIAHPGLGTLDLFLVPIGSVAGGFGYEAVFT